MQYERIPISIVVAGKEKRWDFTVYGTIQHLADWQRDGLDAKQIVGIVMVPDIEADMEAMEQEKSAGKQQ